MLIVPMKIFIRKGRNHVIRRLRVRKGGSKPRVRSWKRALLTYRWEGYINYFTNIPTKKSADLWATGVMDDETWKMVKSDKCPNDVFDCACNGIIDKKGEGECKTKLHGGRWCYVVANSVCTDKKEERGNWWSYAACEGREVDEQEDSTTHTPKKQVIYIFGMKNYII